MYEYSAKCDNVVDGDTVDLTVDLGFGVFRKDRFRLNGLNAPELHSTDTKERESGKKSKTRLEQLALGKTITVRTFQDKQEKYGRYLAELWDMSSTDKTQWVNFNKILLDEGFAKPYDGGKRT